MTSPSFNVREAGKALQRRIDKNSDRLFTFFNSDNLPWNNNNAEHAVRARSLEVVPLANA